MNKAFCQASSKSYENENSPWKPKSPEWSSFSFYKYFLFDKRARRTDKQLVSALGDDRGSIVRCRREEAARREKSSSENNFPSQFRADLCKVRNQRKEFKT